MMGSRNAAVLPLPVMAQAITSRPSIAGGIASDWMGVGRTNPSSLTALTSAGSSFNCVKGTHHCTVLAQRAGHTTPMRGRRVLVAALVLAGVAAAALLIVQRLLGSDLVRREIERQLATYLQQ